MLTLKKKMMVLTLVITGGFMAIVNAEELPTASVRIGPALPLVGDLEDIADTGLSIGVQATHKVNPLDSYGVDVNYFTFGEDSEQNVETSVSIISTLVLTRHSFSNANSASPFLEGGVGFARTQVNIDNVNSSGAPIQRGSNEEDISPTFMIGAGVDMPISGGASFGFSVDYQHFFFKVGDVDGGGSLSILAHLRV